MDPRGAIDAVTALYGAMEPDEQKLFREDLVERLGLVGELSGTVAVAEEVETAETAFTQELGDFLDSESTELSVEAQLETMGRFWDKLGLTVPALSEEQEAKVEATLEVNPGKRVVPTPLLDFMDRVALTGYSKQQFPRNRFHELHQSLWTPDKSTLYGQLLQDPNSIVKQGRDSYGLFYKAPGSVAPVNRQAYTEALLEAGEAVEGSDGTIWTFPVMDVRVRTPRTYASAGELYEQIDSTETPESLVVTQILHQAAGNPNPTWEVDFANEAIYKVNKHGKPVGAPVGVASVRWNPDRRQVNSDAWNADVRGDNFGLRGAVSGI